MLSDHKRIKLKLGDRRLLRKSLNLCKINNTHLYELFKEKSKGKLQSNLKLMETKAQHFV